MDKLLEVLRQEIENEGDQYVKLSRRDWTNAKAAGLGFDEYFKHALVESRLVPR